MGSQSHRQHSDVSCWIPSCPPVAVQRDGGLERPLTQPLHLRGSALAYWLRIISRWSSTALAVNSGVNRLQHVPWSWLSPPVNKSRGLFFLLSLSLLFCLSVSASGEDWGRHTAMAAERGRRPGSSFTPDRLIEAARRRKSIAKCLLALLSSFSLTKTFKNSFHK